MQVAILEDDRYIQKQISSMVGRLRPQWRIKEVDSLEGLQILLSRDKIDVLFADVHLNDGCFFEASFDVPDNISIIVLTGDVGFALKAIERQVIDYLLKPVDLERMLTAIERFECRHMSAKHALGSFEGMQRIKYTHKSGVRLCNIADIALIRANLKTCEIFLCDGERGQVQFGINAFESRFSNSQFWRIHRSYLLNIDSKFQAKRDELGRMNVEIPSLGLTLPVSKVNEKLFRASALI